MEPDEDVSDVDGKTQPVEHPPVLPYQTHMWFQLKTFLTSILLLIALCFGASSKQAWHETWIDIGAIVVEVGPGVVAAIRRGEVLGKLDFSKPLAKTQAPSVNYASPGGAPNRGSPWAGVDTGSRGVGANVPDDVAGWVRGSDGSSLPIRKNAQGLPDWERYLRDNASVTSTSGALDPSSVRFTQNNIGANFSDGRSVDDLVTGLRNGTTDPSSLPPIRTFEVNGQLFSLDNRRLYAYRQAGVDVPTTPATAAEITRDSRFKFSTINGGQDIAVRGQ